VGPDQFDWDDSRAECPGPVTVSVADFTPRGAAFDPARLLGFSFYIDTPVNVPHFAFDFGFCIEDLVFLGANDQPLAP